LSICLTKEVVDETKRRPPTGISDKDRHSPSPVGRRASSQREKNFCQRRIREICEVSKKNHQKKKGVDEIFPPKNERMSHQARLRKIKQIVKNENYVTEEKLEEAIERLIDAIIFS